MKVRNLLLPLAAIGGLAISANAALVNISSVTGHHGGQGHGQEIGTLGEMIDLSGMDTITNGTPNDPSSWLTTGTAWQDEWQSNALLDNTTSNNGKIGWAAIDLGSNTVGLDDLYIWHIRENNERYAATYNIYYATSPTVALPGDPGESNMNVDVGAAGGAGDYNFQGGGWTQLGGTQNGTFRGDQTIALGGITAQYIGLEIITNNGHASRVGFAEIAVTQIPEPGSLALLGLGGLALLRRRRK